MHASWGQHGVGSSAVRVNCMVQLVRGVGLVCKICGQLPKMGVRQDGRLVSGLEQGFLHCLQSRGRGSTREAAAGDGPAVGRYPGQDSPRRVLMLFTVQRHL